MTEDLSASVPPLCAVDHGALRPGPPCGAQQWLAGLRHHFRQSFSHGRGENAWKDWFSPHVAPYDSDAILGPSRRNHETHSI